MNVNTRDLDTELRSALTSQAPEVLTEYPLDAYIRALDAGQIPNNYGFMPALNDQYCQEIEKRWGRGVLEVYLRLVVTTLVGQVNERLAGERIPDSILPLIQTYLDKVQQLVRDGRPGYFVPTNDALHKNIGVCRLRLIPFGPELVDTFSGVPRSALLRGGLWQAGRAVLFFAFRTRGFMPFYMSHNDRYVPNTFTADEYDRGYVRIAELLEMNPTIKGLAGAAWFNDPVMERISPELTFLRTRQQDNGALLLRDRPNDQSIKLATRFSTPRKKLYDEGSYQPTDYWLVWGRQDLINWATRFRATAAA